MDLDYLKIIFREEYGKVMYNNGLYYARAGCIDYRLSEKRKLKEEKMNKKNQELSEIDFPWKKDDQFDSCNLYKVSQLIDSFGSHFN